MKGICDKCNTPHVRRDSRDRNPCTNFKSTEPRRAIVAAFGFGERKLQAVPVLPSRAAAQRSQDDEVGPEGNAIVWKLSVSRKDADKVER